MFEKPLQHIWPERDVNIVKSQEQNEKLAFFLYSPFSPGRNIQLLK